MLEITNKNLDEMISILEYIIKIAENEEEASSGDLMDFLIELYDRAKPVLESIKEKD